MRPVRQETLDQLEELTVDAAKQIKALFAYEGDNTKYLQKAKIAVGVIGGYSRVLASENNRAALAQAHVPLPEASNGLPPVRG